MEQEGEEIGWFSWLFGEKKDKGKLISPPLTQYQNVDFWNNCMIWSAVNEVFDSGAKVKSGYDRQKVMDKFNTETRYSYLKVEAALNEILVDKRVIIEALNREQTQDMIFYGEFRGRRLIVEFSQNHYWGPKSDGSIREGFHWVGYRGLNTDTNKLNSFDSFKGKLINNRGELSQINRGRLINILDK